MATKRATSAAQRSSEAEQHRNLAAFLKTARAQLPALRFCYHCPNEVSGHGPRVERMYKGKRSSVPLEVLQRAQMGVESGVWDWQLLHPNVVVVEQRPPLFWRGIAIELKSADGRLSDEQKAWAEHYTLNGWHTRVFREWHRAAVYLIRWVGGNPADWLGLEG